MHLLPNGKLEENGRPKGMALRLAAILSMARFGKTMNPSMTLKAK